MRLSRLKPAAPAWVHLLLAAGLWTAVGSALAAFGVYWALDGAGPAAPWWLAGALVLGAAKGWLVLARSARKNAARIRERGDGRCLGGFLPWQGYVLVLAMILLGRVVRGGLLPRFAVGYVYAAVGVALLTGSSVLWRALGEVRASARCA